MTQLGVASAQLTGFPTFPVSKSLDGTDITVALTSGYATPAIGAVIPIAARFEWNADRWTIAGSGAWLLATGGNRRNGLGTGLAVGWQVTPFRPGSAQMIWKALARIEAGVSYSELREETGGMWRQVDIPISLGIGWIVPVKELNVLPFFGPAGRLRIVRDPAGNGKTRAGAGFLAGLDAYKANCVPDREGCPHGWGARAGTEVLFIENVRTGGSVEWSLSLGPIRKFY